MSRYFRRFGTPWLRMGPDQTRPRAIPTTASRDRSKPAQNLSEIFVNSAVKEPSEGHSTVHQHVRVALMMNAFHKELHVRSDMT